MAASPRDHPITATVSTHGQLVISTRAAGPACGIQVDSHPALVSQLQRVAQPDVRILNVHPHIHLSRRVSLWAAIRRRRLPRRHYKAYVQRAASSRGRSVEKLRAKQWTENSTHAATGLAALEWKRIRRILGLGPWGEQIIYRLKARAFSLYDVRNGRLGCPHPHCCHEADVDLVHIFWTCPAARSLRGTFSTPWTRLGLNESDVEKACFGLELPVVPNALWEAVAHHKSVKGDKTADLEEAVTALAEGCWRLGAALYFHAVWRWRVQCFDETNDVTAARHRLLLANRLRHGYRNMHLYVQPSGRMRELAAAAGIVTRALWSSWRGSHKVVQPDDPACRYLLFFDGGSRGNPGPGGSGAVVVRLTTDGGPYQIVWAGSMSYAASTTTNNVAENMGLLVGIKACKQYGFTPLHVVGDSAMIITQHAHRKPPRARHLRPLYWRCRRQLAGLQVQTWQHHLRAHNKMADLLANRAMDSLRSTQLRLDMALLDTPKWRALVNLAGGDISHWILNNTEVDSPGATTVTL